MKAIITLKKNYWFLIPYIFFLTTIGIILYIYEKSSIHLFINNINSNSTDFVFKYLTFLGDGITVAIFLITLLFIRFRYFLVASISTFFTTGIVQILKEQVFNHIVRPFAYFKNSQYTLHYIEGVKLHEAYSFPSGHTASAFTIFFLIAIFCKNKTIKFLCFISALSVGFSRVYLSQHFLNDVYFGSLIAVIVSFFSYIWVSSWKNPKLDGNILNKNKIQK